MLKDMGTSRPVVSSRVMSDVYGVRLRRNGSTGRACTQAGSVRPAALSHEEATPALQDRR